MTDLLGHERSTPQRKQYRLLLGANESAEATIIDVSRRGAAVQTAAAPALGTPVVLAGTRARDARAFAGGFAVKFNQGRIARRQSHAAVVGLRQMRTRDSGWQTVEGRGRPAHSVGSAPIRRRLPRNVRAHIGLFLLAQSFSSSRRQTRS
ncbi:MAG: hypothetical protein JWM36_4202 [Hyphomicrobiales bacterium]|nr:hypothetical protein [Hyphomicrobiales bacterium]